MSIDYYYIRRETTGDENSVAQVFFSSYYPYTFYPWSGFYSFEVPQYTTYGGTKNYYGQDPSSIFTNLYRPFIKYVFTANTASLSGDTVMVFDIYKLDYPTYSKFFPDFSKINEQVVENTLETNEQEVVTENGLTSIKNTSKVTTTKNTSNNFINPSTTTIEEIQEKLVSPLITLTAATSGMSSSYYFFPEQFIKKLGIYSNNLFEDKSQYFIDAYFKFTKQNTTEYDIVLADTLETVEFSATTTLDSQENPVTIENGPFTGVDVRGLYFTFFIVPNKPEILQPIPSGTLNTFSPTFLFENVNDGDQYVLDIVQNSNDTGFTGTVYSYPITKQEGQDIQKYSATIKTYKNFRWRIGNIKKLRNIFDIDQYVVTYSDSYQASTPNTSLNVKVGVASDSPYVPDVFVFTPPTYLDDDIGDITLSGQVSGSTVTGATVQLIYPNGTYATQTTNLTGYFEFSGLTEGIYTLNTSYRGYQNDSRIIDITGNQYIEYRLKLLWGNQYDTWGQLSNEVYGYY